jgi:hypothetical protein
MEDAIKTIETAAHEIASKHAFMYAGNFGRGEFDYAVSVRVSGNSLFLSARCNAQISEKRAQEELAKVWAELKPIVLATAPKAKFAKSRGFKVWRQGFTHMGQFCTEGFCRGIELP